MIIYREAPQRVSGVGKDRPIELPLLSPALRLSNPSTAAWCLEFPNRAFQELLPADRDLILGNLQEDASERSFSATLVEDWLDG